MPKLPRELMQGGYSVAVYLPLKPDRVAHRPTTDKRKSGRNPVYGQPVYQDMPVAACDPKGPVAVLFSAAWADHKGAVACTEPACFPNA